MRRLAIPILLCLVSAALSVFGQSAAPAAPVVRSFLYVDPHLVRFELLTPLADLQRAAQLEEAIAPGERAAKADGIATISESVIEVRINGEPRGKPRAEVMFIDSSTASGVPFPIAEGQAIQVKDAHVALSWVLPAEKAVESVEVSFSNGLPGPPAVTSLATMVSFDETNEELRFTADAPSIRWENRGRMKGGLEFSAVPVPSGSSSPIGGGVRLALMLTGVVASIVLWARRQKKAAIVFFFLTGVLFAVTSQRSTAAPTPEQAAAILQPLLENTYLAFHSPIEGQVRTALEKSVSGAVVEQVQVRFSKDLLVPNHTNLRVRVPKENLALEVESVVPKGDGCEAQVTWTALGVVHHLGHPDQRVNKYSAKLSLTPEHGAWKLSGMEITSHKQM